jgi:hypothetical protein
MVKQIKQLTLAAALLTVFVLAQSTITYAAPASSPVGVVNYQLFLQQQPDTPQSVEQHIVIGPNCALKMSKNL